jgi:hypothetical protein
MVISPYYREVVSGLILFFEQVVNGFLMLFQAPAV